jgi:hypothetical protein
MGGIVYMSDNKIKHLEIDVAEDLGGMSDRVEGDLIKLDRLTGVRHLNEEQKARHRAAERTTRDRQVKSYEEFVDEAKKKAGL